MKIITKDPILLKLIIAALISLSILSCNMNNMKETPINDFIGIWELQGRSMFEGIKIKIEKDDNGDFIGKLIKLNENKYVQLFLEKNDKWVTRIERSSNFEFKLTEMKIASDLFSVYDQKTRIEYKVQFIDHNLIGLTTGNSDPLKSNIKYKRVEDNYK